MNTDEAMVLWPIAIVSAILLAPLILITILLWAFARMLQRRGFKSWPREVVTTPIRLVQKQDFSQWTKVYKYWLYQLKRKTGVDLTKTLPRRILGSIVISSLPPFTMVLAAVFILPQPGVITIVSILASGLTIGILTGYVMRVDSSYMSAISNNMELEPNENKGREEHTNFSEGHPAWVVAEAKRRLNSGSYGSLSESEKAELLESATRTVLLDRFFEDGGKSPFDFAPKQPTDEEVEAFFDAFSQQKEP